VTGGDHRLRRALIALCVTEITSWGTLYYSLPAMLVPLSRSTGWPGPAVMGAFSAGLLVSAVAGIAVGRLLDRLGPRPVMTLGSLIGVAALLFVAAAPSPSWFFAAWMLAGLAQSMLLYPPAFAALTRWYGPRRVHALTTLSLVAGLASTVFAPLAALLASHLGWRVTDVVLAAVLGVVTLPLHATMLTPHWPAGRRSGQTPPGRACALVRSRAFALLAAAMVLGALALYAATVDVGTLLTSHGAGNVIAAVALGLVGVGQVCGRLGYATLSRRTSAPARTCAVLAASALAVGLLALTSTLPAAALATAALAGVARGNFTLIQATAVSDRWGTRAFGTVNGIFLAPVTIATALAPGAAAMLTRWLGTPRNAFFLLAGLAAVGSVLALATRASSGQVPASRGLTTDRLPLEGSA
jgi:predicted MFS family arabinose efflux permease